MIAPLGFDWKMGIGLISSFAARDSSRVRDGHDLQRGRGRGGGREKFPSLGEKMKNDVDPRTGQRTFTPSWPSP